MSVLDSGSRWVGLTLLVAGCARADAPAVRTDVPEAREAYVQGQSYMARSLAGDGDSASVAFGRAVELDPDFAQAWAGLAHARVWRQWNEGATGQLPLAEEALANAVRIEPDALETRLARGFVAYYGYRDYDAALADFMSALEEAPDQANVLASVGAIYRRQGRFADAIEYFERRQASNPDHLLGLATLAQTYTAHGRYDEALRVADRLTQLGDARGPLWQFWAHLESGDTATAWTLIPAVKEAQGSVGEPHGLEVLQALLRRDGPSVDALMEQIGLDVGGGLRNNFVDYMVMSGTVASHADAFDAWIETQQSRLGIDRPSDAQAAAIEANAHAQLAWLEAVRGNEAAAREHAAQVEPLDPMGADAWVGRGTLWYLASAHVALGDQEAALDVFEQFLPALDAGAAWMRMYPGLDPIRDNPRFQALIEAREAVETLAM